MMETHSPALENAITRARMHTSYTELASYITTLARETRARLETVRSSIVVSGLTRTPESHLMVLPTMCGSQ